MMRIPEIKYTLLTIGRRRGNCLDFKSNSEYLGVDVRTKSKDVPA